MTSITFHRHVRVLTAAVLTVMFLAAAPGVSRAVQVSSATDDCIGCHEEVTPGIVADWRESRMARVTINEALAKSPLERRISVQAPIQGMGDTVVGCAECHTLSPDRHKDTFDHEGYRVHTVVTPENCAACHPVERSQYEKNLMSEAYGNLVDNSVYRMLIDAVNGVQTFEQGMLRAHAPDDLTNADSCLACHGTEITVQGVAVRETDMGEMEFPVLTGWPNQ